MTESIKALDYWPTPGIGAIQCFHYKDAGPQADTVVSATMPDMYSLFVWDDKTSSLLYVDYDKDMKWKDTWYIRHRLGKGLEEWRDDNIIEKTDWKTKIFGTRNKIVFRDDYPIRWGDVVELGKTYTSYPKSNFFACSPPQLLNGTQSFCYQERIDSFNGYKDVVTLIYNQAWGKNNGGAKYWMARGIGPVAVQWITRQGDKVITTNRMDATVTWRTGFAKDIQT